MLQVFDPDQWRSHMHIEGWMVTAAVVLLVALVAVVVGLLSRMCHTLCQKLENCSKRGEWPCRS